MKTENAVVEYIVELLSGSHLSFPPNVMGSIKTRQKLTIRLEPWA